jgi:hemolysin III
MDATREHLVDLAIQGCGLAAALAGTVTLVMLSMQWGDGMAVAATAAYGASLIAMFVCSILNARSYVDPNADPGRREFIRLLDHAAIYLLIAGTYTPFCLLMIGGRRGAVLLAGVWLAAAIGIAMRAKRRFEHLGILLYVLLGWSGVVQMAAVVERLPPAATLLLTVGGVIYTLAAPVHRWTGLRYHDAIWHGSVVAAAACHYAAILLWVAGPHPPAS